MKRPRPKPQPPPNDGSARARILDAAFEVLRAHGYRATQTREIAARARVSKRDIYSEFGSKEGIFAALITARAELMRGPAAHPDLSSGAAFQATLHAVGAAFLTQLYDPAVVSMFRLAIASAEAAPEIARILDRNGLQPNRRAMGELMAVAVKAGMVAGEPSLLAARFFGLLIGNDQFPVLLGTADAPKPRDIPGRVADAVAAFLRLHGRARPLTPARSD